MSHDLARLCAEYRNTMDKEVLHAWARDVVAALRAEKPVAYVNGDDLANMLDDRTAEIQAKPDGFRRTPLYAARATLEQEKTNGR